MPKQTIFQRAGAAVQKGSSAECGKLIAELQSIARAEAADLRATAPPEPIIHHDGAGRPAGRSMGDPGERYRVAALSDDQEKLAAVMAEHYRLAARAQEIGRLIHRLQERAKTAAADEAKAAAPKRAAAIVSEIETALDTLEAAQAEYLQARAEVVRLQQDLLRQRELVDDDVGTLSLPTFRRLGEALAHNLRRHVTPTQDINGRDTTTAHLFNSPSRALQLARSLLPSPSEGVLAAISAKLTTLTGLNASDTHRAADLLDGPHPQAVADQITSFQRQRLALITRGDVEGATQLRLDERGRAA